MSAELASDLHTPIMPKKREPGALMKRIKALGALLVRAGAVFLLIVVAALALWIIVTDDEFGGEPIAVAPITVPGERSGDVGEPSDRPQMLRGSGDSTEQTDGPRIIRVPQQAMEPASPAELGRALQNASAAPRFDPQGGLRALADPALVERFDADSFIPTIGAGGERPLDAYARPLEAGTVAPGQPRIAIIVSGLAMSQTATQEVINRLPGAMTLSFAPYGNSLGRWTQRARAAGHEYLIEVPMEPFDYPNNDPGPHTLLASLDAQANIERLHWALSRVSTPVGFMNYMGSRFASEEALLEPIVTDTLGRGLMIVDDGRSARSRLTAAAGEGQPAVRADVVIDAQGDTESIAARLSQLEAFARQRGSAIGVASALPITISTLEEWSQTLSAKGIALVPVSSLARFE